MTDITVWIMGEDSTSIGSWQGPPPSPGDLVVVERVGEGCSDPRRITMRVVRLDWQHTVRYPSSIVPWTTRLYVHVWGDIVREEILNADGTVREVVR